MERVGRGISSGKTFWTGLDGGYKKGLMGQKNVFAFASHVQAYIYAGNGVKVSIM
jgi:hypothetical protein